MGCQPHDEAGDREQDDGEGQREVRIGLAQEVDLERGGAGGAGERAREGEGGLSRFFLLKPIWQRAVIAAAGPMANFVLAVVIFAALILALGENLLPAKVASVAPGSPAAAAGFRPADLLP